mmetsp:Transcript_27769/g.70788  ORF Transcript_27769/g.70788 Transcript_27769/m.70788 type:complete len:268 (+) Transcript_27769:216-1019(+)
MCLSPKAYLLGHAPASGSGMHTHAHSLPLPSYTGTAPPLPAAGCPWPPHETMGSSGLQCRMKCRRLSGYSLPRKHSVDTPHLNSSHSTLVSITSSMGAGMGTPAFLAIMVAVSSCLQRANVNTSCPASPCAPPAAGWMAIWYRWLALSSSSASLRSRALVSCVCLSPLSATAPSEYLSHGSLTRLNCTDTSWLALAPLVPVPRVLSACLSLGCGCTVACVAGSSSMHGASSTATPVRVMRCTLSTWYEHPSVAVLHARDLTKRAFEG